MQYDDNAEKYGYEGEMTPMKCDELQSYKGDVTIPVYGTIADAEVYLKKDVDEAIAKLKDKCQMHDFFWEGCGFAKRGFKNTIAVSEAFDRLEAENAELKKKLMPCLNGDCILTCEVVEKYGKENAELKQKLEDAGMRERRLKRALWLARAERAEAEHAHWATIWFCNTKISLNINKSSISQDPYKSNTFRNASEWRNMWCNIASKCLKKAKEYK